MPGFKTATDGTFTLDTSSVAALTDVTVTSVKGIFHTSNCVHNSVTSTTLGFSLTFTFGERLEAGGRVSVSLGRYNNVNLSLPLTGQDSKTTTTARLLIPDGGEGGGGGGERQIDVQCSFSSVRGMTASHRIKFDPLVPGQATAIELSRQLSTAMKEYETVFLSLPNFRGSSKKVPISGSSARYFSAVWSKTCGATSAHVLVLVVKQEAIIRPYESMNIVVESLGLNEGYELEVSVGTDAVVNPWPAVTGKKARGYCSRPVYTRNTNINLKVASNLLSPTRLCIQHTTNNQRPLNNMTVSLSFVGPLEPARAPEIRIVQGINAEVWLFMTFILVAMCCGINSNRSAQAHRARPRVYAISVAFVLAALQWLLMLTGGGFVSAAKNRGWLLDSQLGRGSRPLTRLGYGITVRVNQ
jgi:hypothetical protein